MDKTMELSFPTKGLDESQPLFRQPPGTTQDCMNVRPWNARNGRDQGASRPGLKKLMEDREQVNGSYSIQEVAQMSVSSGEAYRFGEGGIYGPGSSGGWTILDNDGSQRHTLTGGSNWTAVFDDIGDYYVGFGDSSTPTYTVALVVQKYSRDTGAMIWTKTLDETTGVPQRILGMAIRRGVLYVYAGEDVSGATATVSPTVTTKLYRVSTGSGEDVGTNPWLTSASSLLKHATLGAGSVFVENSTNSHMAIGETKICLATYNATDNAARAQIISIDSGAIDTTVNLKTAGEYGVSDVQADGSDNFYICFANNTAGVVSAAPVTDTVRMINSAGTTQWTYTGSTRVYGVTYDRHLAAIAICGDALGGSASVNVGILNSSGTLTSSASLNGGAVCRGIRSDGRSGFVCFFGSGVFIKASSALAAVWTSTYTGYGAYKGAVCHGWEAAASSSGNSRVTRNIVISGGLVAAFDKNGIVSATSGSSATSSAAQIIMSTQVGPRLYFVDGSTTFKRYNPITHAVETWSASAGSLPVNGSDGPRLCESWRGRLWLSGITSDPQNWFLSKVNDPTNYDYGPATTTSVQAVAGNDPDVGKSPDIVNCGIPVSNTEFFMGCDHSIVKFTGDPMAGGRLEVVSDVIGMAFGRPWCRSPDGSIFFVSSMGFVYRLGAAGELQRLSQAIDKRLGDIDVSKHIYRVIWDDRYQGFHLFITPFDKQAKTVHYWWDQGTGSWWPDSFADPNFNPKCCFTLDGDSPEDRVVVLGSWDGYLRVFDPAAKDDDGKVLSSRVLFSPLVMKGLSGFTLKDLWADLDKASDKVAWSIRAGHSVQDAVDRAVQQKGAFKGGRNQSPGVRVFGMAALLELSQAKLGEAWAMESMHAILGPAGPSRSRMYT